MPLDSFGQFFTYCILNISLDFYNLCKFSLPQVFDPNLSFVQAAASPWEWEEGSFQEIVSSFYSLFPLDYFDIGLSFIYYIIASFLALIHKVFKKCVLTRFFIIAAGLIQVFSSIHNALKWLDNRIYRVLFCFPSQMAKHTGWLGWCSIVHLLHAPQIYEETSTLGLFHMSFISL